MFLFLTSFFLGLFSCCTLFATEYKPWFGPEKLFEIRTPIRYQNYQRVETGDCRTKFHSNDYFLSGSISITPRPLWNGEFECTLGQTTTNGFNIIDEKATIRYLILDDVVGDPVSLTTGLSISHVHPRALHDVSIFHHGRAEFEYHIAIGKEFPCEQFWNVRVWSILGIGVANRGDPWIRWNVSWEKNWWNRHQVHFFANSLWGLGHNKLFVASPFSGYAFVRHQHVDLGFRYTYFLFPPYGTISLEYFNTIYARNAPVNVNSIQLSLLIPLNL